MPVPNYPLKDAQGYPLKDAQGYVRKSSATCESCCGAVVPCCATWCVAADSLIDFQEINVSGSAGLTRWTTYSAFANVPLSNTLCSTIWTEPTKEVSGPPCAGTTISRTRINSSVRTRDYSPPGTLISDTTGPATQIMTLCFGSGVIVNPRSGGQLPTQSLFWGIGTGGINSVLTTYGTVMQFAIAHPPGYSGPAFPGTSSLNVIDSFDYEWSIGSSVINFYALLNYRTNNQGNIRLQVHTIDLTINVTPHLNCSGGTISPPCWTTGAVQAPCPGCGAGTTEGF